MWKSTNKEFFCYFCEQTKQYLGQWAMFWTKTNKTKKNETIKEKELQWILDPVINIKKRQDRFSYIVFVDNIFKNFMQ